MLGLREVKVRVRFLCWKVEGRMGGEVLGDVESDEDVIWNRDWIRSEGRKEEKI